MDETTTEGGARPQPNDYESLLNTKIGNYIIDKLIGTGGHGTTFKAFHELLGTVVAIKISHPLTESPDKIKAFLQHGYSALPTIRHPNICRILDFGQLTHQGKERFYVVQDYVDGEHLCHLPAPQTKADVNYYIDLWAQICDAIAYVHQQHYFNSLGFEVTGIYHADIKPDNIILDRKTGRPKLIDFLYQDLTMLFGTTGYMAPEQEHHGQISARTEVYSLGVTLFRLLTTSPNERNQISSFKAGNSPEEIRTLLDNPLVSTKICTIISKATQVNPADRYNQVQDLLDALKEEEEAMDLPPPPLAMPKASAPQWNYRNKIAFRRTAAAGRQKWQGKPLVNQPIEPTFKINRLIVAGLIILLLGLLGWGVVKLTQPTKDFSSSSDTSRSLIGARISAMPDGSMPTVDMTGNYYALLIGVNVYQDDDIKDLNQPIDDLESLKDVLTRFYTFNPVNVIALKNPTRNDIVEQFDKLLAKITTSDNLLLFYAGHGVYDEQLKQGDWLPADARKDNRANWLANSTIREYINGIKARHILLISDACYSGSFLVLDRGEPAKASVKQAYSHNSRKAITSSTMEVVPDESIFAEELVSSLERNADHFLSASELYRRFAPVVTDKNASQLPQFGRIKGDADRGGDFIFIKR